MVLRTKVFNYTGDIQFFTVPERNRYIKVYCWGAGGGAGYSTDIAQQMGGGGGYCSGIIPVNSGENLAVIVGQGGRGKFNGASGGWGGDDIYGNGHGGNGDLGNILKGAGGGGMSAIIRVSDLKPIIIAGSGGGGMGDTGSGKGGAGGGLIGQNGLDSWSGGNSFGYGAGDPLHTNPSGTFPANPHPIFWGKNSNHADVGGGGGGGGWAGGGAGGSGGSTAGSGGGGNSGCDDIVINFVTEGGNRQIPGGITSPNYTYPIGYGGAWDYPNPNNEHENGRNGQVIIEYGYYETSVNIPPQSLPCYPLCIPLLKGK